MPSRNNNKEKRSRTFDRIDQQTEYEVKYGDTLKAINLDFLPDELRKKIYRTFDRYFGFGLLSQVAYKGEKLPSFPNSVATLDSDEVGDYLGKFTAWYAFTADKKKYLVVALNVVENELDIIFRQELATMTTKANLEIKKAAARVTEDYLIVEEYVQEVANLMDMLDIELSKLDKTIASLSREISRRERTPGL